jgi:hypothetical protein
MFFQTLPHLLAKESESEKVFDERNFADVYKMSFFEIQMHITNVNIFNL